VCVHDTGVRSSYTHIQTHTCFGVSHAGCGCGWDLYLYVSFCLYVCLCVLKVVVVNRTSALLSGGPSKTALRCVCVKRVLHIPTHTHRKKVPPPPLSPPPPPPPPTHTHTNPPTLTCEKLRRSEGGSGSRKGSMRGSSSGGSR
jgi:hypothetical protein